MRHRCLMSSHKPIIIYMGGSILGVNTLYMLFYFFKLFPIVGKGLSVLSRSLSVMACRDASSLYLVLLLLLLLAWKPSLKVSCKGTVTIQNLSGLDCNSEHDISCTIKIDSEFQVGIPTSD